jgi:hypothetical protein
MSAYANIDILPGETISGVLDYDRFHDRFPHMCIVFGGVRVVPQGVHKDIHSEATDWYHCAVGKDPSSGKAVYMLAFTSTTTDDTHIKTYDDIAAANVVLIRERMVIELPLGWDDAPTEVWVYFCGRDGPLVRDPRGFYVFRARPCDCFRCARRAKAASLTGTTSTNE